MFRIKERPEDFVVYEVADIYPEGSGDYSLYRLKKRGLTTWDVLGEIAKRLRLRQDEIGYGGLKDRHALSYQFVTIPRGPKRDLKGEGWRLEYLGQTRSPMSKAKLKGNYFEIVVRDVEKSPSEIKEAVEEVKVYGLPNYFDEQRFGSVRHLKGFVAKEVVFGNYERALYLLLAEGSQYDYAETEEFRECVKRHWPKVGPCVKLAPSPWERRLLEFLRERNPSRRTFKRAFTLVDSEYLMMLSHAYQAYLWNEVLKEYLKDKGLELHPSPYLLGELLFYKEVPCELFEELKSTKLPLPSPKLSLSPELEQIYLKVLQREGIPSLKKFRSLVKGVVFKTYPREAVVIPKDLEYDFLRVGEKSDIKIKFFLPKGSYATLVLKRLFSPLPS